MNPEFIHYLQDVASRPEGQRLLLGLAVALPVGWALLFWAIRRRVRPMTVWATITVAGVMMSQSFPQNWPRLAEDLVVFSLLGAVAATWYWRRVFRSFSREVGAKQGSVPDATDDPDSSPPRRDVDAAGSDARYTGRVER